VLTTARIRQGAANFTKGELGRGGPSAPSGVGRPAQVDPPRSAQAFRQREHPRRDTPLTSTSAFAETTSRAQRTDEGGGRYFLSTAKIRSLTIFQAGVPTVTTSQWAASGKITASAAPPAAFTAST
jgi:hypothetical protein